MKPIYSISELADILNESDCCVANGLVAANVPVFFNGKKIDLADFDCFRPLYSGEAIVVRTGVPPEPCSNNVFVSVDTLPDSWKTILSASIDQSKNDGSVVTIRIDDYVVAPEDVESPRSALMDSPIPKEKKIYKRVPKSRCIYVVDLIKAACQSGTTWGVTVTMAEATDAIVSSYHGDEMLFDGCRAGLIEPYSEKYAPIDGDDLLLKMCDAITDLYNIPWWAPNDSYKNSDSLFRAENLMVLEQEYRPIWSRMCDLLFEGKHKDDYWESIADVERQKGDVDHPEGTVDSDAVESPDALLYKPETNINSKIHERLMRAINGFPSRYPDYRTKPPKLDDDVRLWLKESGLGDNDAERRVFGAIIREHFNLSPDTQKTQ